MNLKWDIIVSSPILVLYLYVQQPVIVLAPVAPHPVSAVAARPVDVLAVRLVNLVQVRFHTFLDP